MEYIYFYFLIRLLEPYAVKVARTGFLEGENP